MFLLQFIAMPIAKAFVSISILKIQALGPSENCSIDKTKEHPPPSCRYGHPWVTFWSNFLIIFFKM